MHHNIYKEELARLAERLDCHCIVIQRQIEVLQSLLIQIEDARDFVEGEY
jgi:hypothetical protein